jgi:hypothetical protein
MLVKAGYSMMAILRMLIAFDQDQVKNVRLVLDTPRDDEDIFTASDQWLSTLDAELNRANRIISKLELMIESQTR